jgi:hypothetical protein
LVVVWGGFAGAQLVVVDVGWGIGGDAPSFPFDVGRQVQSRWTSTAGGCLEQLVVVSNSDWLMDVLGGAASPSAPSDTHGRFERW